jgi:hypothetical protein
MAAIQVEVDVLARKLIRKACVKPSENFGELVLEVDHEMLGQLARKHREQEGIKAVRIADALSISKCRLNFLETGYKRWTRDILRNYLSAVYTFHRKAKSERNVVS